MNIDDNLFQICISFMNANCSSKKSDYFFSHWDSLKLKEMMENSREHFCYDEYDKEHSVLCYKCKINIQFLRVICKQNEEIKELKQEVLDIKNMLQK